MNKNELENMEIELLLEGIYKRYGYDFRNYASASLKRRLHKNLITSNSKNFIELLDKVLHDKTAFETFLFDLSVTVTEMFRDPYIYLAIRKTVVPLLKTYPFIKIWHAGCATGEEVYSMAILLYEEGLLDKTQLYATDINLQALEIGQEGIYPGDKIKQYAKNYQLAGGKKDFSDYYHLKYGSIKLSDFLRKKITFAYHNLAVDHSFCEVQMVICRNVLIYFNRSLQDHVLQLFSESLCEGGFLFLGSKETLNFSTVKDQFQPILDKEKLFQKRYPKDGEGNA